MSELHEKVDQHGKDISAMAVAVAEVTQIIKGVERRHEENMTAVKDAMVGIQKLFEKDVTSLKEDVGELKAEYRVIKRDLNNDLNTLLAIPALKEQVTENKTKIAGIETWRNKIAGGTEASRIWVIVLWAIFGTGVLTIGGFLVRSFFIGSEIDVNIQ